MTVQTPCVSVVMTTYRNSWPALQRAIDSILAQTFRDFEFIIVFEPGDDNYQRTLDHYGDPRLDVVLFPQRAGRSPCHNLGVSRARGHFVARMDADDYSYPDRLEKEIAFLKSHSDIAVVGGAGRLVDDEGHVLGIRHMPQSHEQIMRDMAIVNPIFHPSVMWDRTLVGADVRYHPDLMAEDLELWLRLAGRGLKFANLPDILIDYTSPPRYNRPRLNWFTNFKVRLLNWRACLKYPRLALGIPVMAMLTILPQGLANMLSERNPVSDRLRSIVKNADGA
jgi:glycosyltransferase involved in cell wall biosynthesis